MAVYTPTEYSQAFLIHNKRVSPATVKRRAAKGMLPSNHIAKKLPGRTGGWVIEVEKLS